MRLFPRLYLLGLAISAQVLSAAQALSSTDDGPLPHVRAPKYPTTKKCDPTRCICTPEAFVEAFLATPNLSGNDTTNPDLENQVIPFPLCVGEHLVGRVNGGNVPPAVETIFSVKFGTQMIFAIDYIGLQSILALGQYRAKEILALLGFGVLSEFPCSAPQWQNLLVFEMKEPAVPGACRRKDPNEPDSQIPTNCNKSPIMSAIWDNAVPWLEQVYKKDLSHLEPLIDTIKSQRFQALTGCRPIEMTQLSNRYNATQLKSVGCSDAFADAVPLFRNTLCHKGTPTQMANFPGKYLYYSGPTKRGAKQNYCDSDIIVQNLGPGDAVTLRAFFYGAQAFNQFYTGYGFTANRYQAPSIPEFWINNALFSKLDYASVPLNCSLSSDPSLIQALDVGGPPRGRFIPYMVGDDHEDF